MLPSTQGHCVRELSLSADAFVMAIVGRIVPIKNHALFLRAARTVVAKHPETVVLVVGDGDQRAATEQLAAQLDLRPQVLFLGWRRDLPAVYADTDLLVVSSNNEGTPVAAIEAMAARCPVVATRVGGVPDLISDRVTGMLVPPGDPERLAQALIYARDHPSRNGALGTVGPYPGHRAAQRGGDGQCRRSPLPTSRPVGATQPGTPRPTNGMN